MEGFFDGLEQAVRDQNWHAALVMTLTLPDICVVASDPTRKTNGARYAEWFDTYLGPTYTRTVGAGEWRETITFLSGDDCYALRCALLHEGGTDTSGHKASKALSNFQLCVPGENGNQMHRNMVDDKLNLMVDTFAEDMLAGARAWWSSLTPDQQNAARERQLVLHDTDGDISIG